MHCIILLLLLNSCSYLCAMDQDAQEDYVFDAVTKYASILHELLERKSNDPALWLESCEQAGKLKACIELGIINSQPLEDTAQNILKEHKQTTLTLINRMTLEQRLTAATEKE